jgi:hypothetical protein
MLTIQVFKAGLSCGTFLRRSGVGDETSTLAYFLLNRLPFGKAIEAISDRKVCRVLLRRGVVWGHGGALIGSRSQRGKASRLCDGKSREG